MYPNRAVENMSYMISRCIERATYLWDEFKGEIGKLSEIKGIRTFENDPKGHLDNSENDRELHLE